MVWLGLLWFGLPPLGLVWLSSAELGMTYSFLPLVGVNLPSFVWPGLASVDLFRSDAEHLHSLCLGLFVIARLGSAAHGWPWLAKRRFVIHCIRLCGLAQLN